MITLHGHFVKAIGPALSFSRNQSITINTTHNVQMYIYQGKWYDFTFWFAFLSNVFSMHVAFCLCDPPCAVENSICFCFLEIPYNLNSFLSNNSS
ncbi:Uncharacterised protein [Mycobacteroides abscessus subsp. abscessus]|nr:Uncharacterised protein [Mycobacteroides abscessus subsp. abscessus]